MLSKTLDLAAGTWDAMQLHRKRLGLKLQLSGIRSTIRRIKRLPDEAYAAIETACRKAAQAQMDAALQRTPISVLADYGANVSILQRHGYRSLYELKNVSIYELQQLPYIGPVRSNEIVNAYDAAAKAVSRRVKILPSGDIHDTPDLTAIVAIAKWNKLHYECAEQLSPLVEREATLSAHLKQHPVPTKEIIRNKGIRGSWHDYKAEIRVLCTTLKKDCDIALSRLMKTDVSGPSALQSYWQNPARFRAIVNQYEIKLQT